MLLITRALLQQRPTGIRPRIFTRIGRNQLSNYTRITRQEQLTIAESIRHPPVEDSIQLGEQFLLHR